MPIFRDDEGLPHRVLSDGLLLEQRRSSLLVGQDGSVRLCCPALTEDPSRILSAIVDEELRDRIADGLRCVSWVLDQIDQQRRLSEVVLLACLLRAGYAFWLTRQQWNAYRGTMTMRSGHAGVDRLIVALTPPNRSRVALVHQAEDIAEDLAVLLERGMHRDRDRYGR